MPNETGLWQNGLLELPESFWAAYVAELKDRDVFDKASAGTAESAIYGGAKPDEAIAHFCYRLSTGASRLTYFLLDPRRQFSDDQAKFLQSLSSGRISILDMGSGAGGSAIALLSTLAELRKQKKLPTIPLNICLIGADFSETALGIFSALLPRVYESLLEQGIQLTFAGYLWDMTSPEQTNELCESWFNRSTPDATDEYILLVANITGIGKEVSKRINRSMSHIVERLSNKTSSLLWVEPGTNNASSIMKALASSIFGSVGRWILGNDMPPKALPYTWRDRVTNKDVPSQVRIARYQRSY